MGLSFLVDAQEEVFVLRNMDSKYEFTMSTSISGKESWFKVRFSALIGFLISVFLPFS
jgi:hypothetical protein